MSMISAATYPDPPSLDGGDDGLRPSAPGVVKSQGRGQVATPQALIVLQATVRKDEIQRRKREANGCRDKDLFAPAIDNPTAFNVKKGMPCFCRLTHGTFRGGLQADAGSNVEVICNMAGLPRGTKLGMPSVVQVNREVDVAGGDDRTTIVPDGVQTVVNTGMQHINVGDKVILDPNTAMIESNGRMIPAVDVEGLPSGQYYSPQVRALHTNTLHSMVYQWTDRLRCKLGDDNMERSKMRDVDGPVRLGKHLQLLVDNVMLDDKLAQDMPIKGYLSVWLPWYLLKLVGMGSDVPAMKNGSQTTWLIWCMQLLRVRLCEVESAFAAVVTDYDASLPHNLQSRRAALASKFDYSVKSEKLEKALSDEGIAELFHDPSKIAQATHTLFGIQARLDLFAMRAMEVMLYEQLGWLNRFVFGVALSSAGKGKPLDILVGRNH